MYRISRCHLRQDYATIEVIEESLLQNAAEMGAYLMDGLRDLMNKHQIIGDVRGKGLMIGIELVRDRNSKEPHPDALHHVENECFKRGLITLGCGVSTIRLSPPLVIDRGQCDFALKMLDEVIATVAG